MKTEESIEDRPDAHLHIGMPHRASIKLGSTLPATAGTTSPTRNIMGHRNSIVDACFRLGLGRFNVALTGIHLRAH